MSPSSKSWHIADFSNCAVIVAHPDDETLWSGGTILLHPDAKWTIITICRKSDPDRQEKFFQALEQFNANGTMGDMDDGPEQKPLSTGEVQDTIMNLLPSDRYDLVITHSVWGEYTKHLRHEETAKAVLALCETSTLHAEQLWTFAYEDGNKKYLPRPIQDADIYIKLSDEIWQKKYEIITDIYGFSSDSFEAKTTPREEAFWLFGTAQKKTKA
jgi:LmbE family N-acetylglucosaminyl deacetylase